MDTLVKIEEFGIEELEARTETTWYYYYCNDLTYVGVISGYHWAYAVCWYYWA